MIYFAYGSNLDPAQMAERCPDSPFLAVARLDDHRLDFPRRSPIRRCAVASVVPSPGAVVWGGLYRMAKADLDFLDRREGYFPDRPKEESRYLRIAVRVIRRDGAAVRAMTYVAVPEASPGRPSPEYLAHLVEGAIHRRLPPDYIAMLRTRPTSPAL